MFTRVAKIMGAGLIFSVVMTCDTVCAMEGSSGFEREFCTFDITLAGGEGNSLVAVDTFARDFIGRVSSDKVRYENIFGGGSTFGGYCALNLNFYPGSSPWGRRCEKAFTAACCVAVFAGSGYVCAGGIAGVGGGCACCGYLDEPYITLSVDGIWRRRPGASAGVTVAWKSAYVLKTPTESDTRLIVCDGRGNSITIVDNDPLLPVAFNDLVEAVEAYYNARRGPCSVAGPHRKML